MHAVPTLPELQHRFLAALYDAGDGPIESIAGNGLEADARLRIYRRSCSEIQTGALRAAYPAVLALVGEAFFEQTAHACRRAYPSQSGNLQTFGTHFADYLASLPETRSLPYLPDVARLEWLRQEVALANDAESLPPAAIVHALTNSDTQPRIDLHPSVRLLASRHAVLTIWRYAIQPTPERLQLSGTGEHVALWREDCEVAMAVLDIASYAYLETLMRGFALDAARATACGLDPAFDSSACMLSLATQRLVTGIGDARGENSSS